MSSLVLQGTSEWRAMRCGKVTASRVADVVAKTKTGWGAARTSYMGQLMAERLTGLSQEAFVSPAMKWGIEYEDKARTAYEFWTDQDVESIGFVGHARLSMSGASPDGLVGEEGLLEIKCPTTVTHIDTLSSEEPPLKYLPQMQWQMACTNRTWCDFVSFDPRMPESLRIYIHRVIRDDAFIAELESSIQTFLHELDTRLLALSRAKRYAEAA